MGIMVSKEDDNSELNRRISADLRTRAQSQHRHDPDYVEDTAYMENTKKTGRFTWVWVLLVVLAIISIFCIILI